MKKETFKHLKNITSSKILAILFLVFSLYVGLSAIPQLLINSGTAVTEKKTFSEYITLIDEQYNDMLTTEMDQAFWQNKSTYINFNGLMANLMDQKELNGVYKLNNGHLNTFNEPYEEIILRRSHQRLNSLYEHQKERGKSFLFVLAPSQTYQQDELLPTGFTETINETGDRLIAALEESGVPCLDLRKVMEQEGITNTEAFYITDHHWKAETGFWAYGKILEKLAESGSIAPVDTTYTDPENFNFDIYEDAFLGSSGKRTGIYYAGVEDFCVITPKFETEMSLAVENTSVKAAGSFAEVALRSDTYEVCTKKDYFNQNCYGVYGLGDRPHTHWRNENAPEQQKVIMIGDSFGNVPFSFMPLYFSSCEELDMRHFKGDFAELYDEYEPDQFIVLANVASLHTKNTLYAFFPGTNS